jgi:hypothetical protein
MMAERENDDEPEPVAPNDNESDVEGQANDDYNRRLRNSLGGTAASSDEEDYDDHADDETNNGGDNTTAV